MTSQNLCSLIAKYDRPAPRYTSFPTAVQFRPSTPADRMEITSRIGQTPQSDPVSVYLHIPFCHSLCHYCGCHTKIVSRYDPVSRYVNDLCAEIRLWAKICGKKPPASQIHFGGGSPNFTSIEDMARIIEALNEAFNVGPETEIALECDPRLLDRKKIKAYASLNVTRVSLGVQDFDSQVQSAINRIQPLAKVQKCVDELRDEGIRNINFDLMIGLPEQTIKTVERTLTETVRLRPGRIAVFAYAHVPWMKKHQALLEKYDRPDSLSRYKMAENAKNFLTGRGYQAIGIDHFALPEDTLAMAQKSGNLHRNFQGYTDDTAKTLVGFGLSAISQFDDMYLQNTTNPVLYRNAIKDTLPPVSRMCCLTEEDKARRKIIERIMCEFTADLTEFPNIKMPLADLTPMLDDGLVEISKNEKTLSVTERGRPFVRLAASCFDPYFQPTQENRHARAV